MKLGAFIGPTMTGSLLLTQGVQFKIQPKTIPYYGTTMKGPRCATDTHNLQRNTQFKVTFVARPLLMQLRKRCAGVNMMYSRAEREFTFGY
jgi:hypothetical protein